MSHQFPLYLLGMGIPAHGEDISEKNTTPTHPLLTATEVIIGGKAHLAALHDHPAEKLVVDANTEALYAQIKQNYLEGKRQVALCTGDPSFFGLGARLVSVLGTDAIRIVPGISSLQATAALLGRSWEHIRPISLHGRDSWLCLAHALMGRSSVFILTDNKNSPDIISSWMLQRGCWRYSMNIVENLWQAPDGTVHAENRERLSLVEAQAWKSKIQKGDVQRVLLLEPEASLLPGPSAQPWPFGLTDADVVKENKLLTKAPVRAAALAALGIETHHVIWDLGAGSGAVSIEASRLAWQGQVFAVERDSSRVAMIYENRKRYGAANLEIIQGQMPACFDDGLFASGEGKKLPSPHRIFIGGGLGGSCENAASILQYSWNALLPGGRLLVDCVLLSSLERTRAVLHELGAQLSVTCLQASVSCPLAGDLRLEALNPVFLVVAHKAMPEAAGDSSTCPCTEAG